VQLSKKVYDVLNMMKANVMKNGIMQSIRDHEDAWQTRNLLDEHFHDMHIDVH